MSLGTVSGPVVHIGRGLALEEVTLDEDPFADPLMIQNFQFSVSVDGDILHMTTEVISSDETQRLVYREAKTRMQSYLLLLRHELEQLEVELAEIVGQMKSGTLTPNQIDAFGKAVVSKTQHMSLKNRTFNQYQKELNELGEEPRIAPTYKMFVYHVSHGQPVDLILPNGETYPIVFFKSTIRPTVGPIVPF
jgi:hypothetical protein